MEIPFDGILTLLIFLIGIPALVLQLISAAERRVAMKEDGLDVRSSFVIALLVVGIGLILQFGYAYLGNENDIKPIVQQAIWLIVFIPLIVLALRVAKRIPEQYGHREKIVEKLTLDILNGLKKKIRIGGGPFSDLANLGKQCNPGQEREMVVVAYKNIVKAVIANPAYKGDSFEMLIDDLVHMLASDPESKDLSNYEIAIKILSAILSAKLQMESGYDRQRAIHAVSKLGQTLIVNFRSVERDNIILEYIDSLELALSRQEMLTEVSQALFEIGVCAVGESHDFVYIAILDKMTALAEAHSPLPPEFITDLLGLLAHFWVEDGSRKNLAWEKFDNVKKFLPESIISILETAQAHLIKTMYFDEADKLFQVVEDFRMLEKEKKKPNSRKKAF